MKVKIHRWLLIIFALSAVLLPYQTLAAQVLPACTAKGDCGVCDFLDTFVNIIRWVLSFIGGAALVMMVWHGFGWIMSGGSETKIKESRDGLVHTILAVVIILAAWQIVNMIIYLLVVTPNDPADKKISLFGGNQAWYEYCKSGNGTTECTGRADFSPCQGGKGSCSGGTCQMGLSACVNLADPKKYDVNGKDPYEGYSCQAEANCNPNYNLGVGYCGNADSCCKPK
jgi:hypothetical protein